MNNLNPHEIISAYRFILGRDPESKNVIENGCRHFSDWQQLRNSMLKSEEACRSLWDHTLSSRAMWIKVPTFFGRNIYISLSDNAVSKEIFLTRQWEPEVAAQILQILKPGDTFLDVGANIGWFSLLAGDFLARADKPGRVIAVEANPSLLPYLMASIVESGLASTISVKPYAASSAPGLVQMSSVEEGNLGGLGIASVAQQSSARNIVPSVKLDDILTDLTRLDLVKIDIEGAEPLAIEGLENTIKKFKPDIIMEINEIGLQFISKKSICDLINQMSAMGYVAINFRVEGGDLGIISTERVSKIVKEKGYFDFIFRNKDR